jgi:NAD(P)-dependent dehydrogenase (short-subunit alcohol dehydrogenase family)
VGQELKDRVAIITGGSSGIGLAISMRYAQAGARVAILSRDEKQLKSATEDIAKVGGFDKVLPVMCDVRREADVLAAFQKTLHHFSQIDILVCNAGITFSASIEETSLEIWQDIIDTNCTGYFIAAKEAVRTFKRQGEGGVIVFISSDNSIKPSKNALAYNVSKAAVNHMARCIADECGRDGIRINTILPGAVFGNSAFWTPEFRAARAAIHGFDPDNLEEEYKKATALGVIIFPEEVAELALFLASDRAAKITGALISIDGGGASGYVR